MFVFLSVKCNDFEKDMFCASMGAIITDQDEI